MRPLWAQGLGCPRVMEAHSLALMGYVSFERHLRNLIALSHRLERRRTFNPVALLLEPTLTMVILMSTKEIVPKIKSFWSSDAELKTYLPDDPKNFMIAAQVDIGPAGKVCSDYFQFIVCTPSWLREEVYLSLPLIRKGQMLVSIYDYNEVYSELEKFVTSCKADNWQEVIKRLCSSLLWEYEGMSR